MLWEQEIGGSNPLTPTETVEHKQCPMPPEAVSPRHKCKEIVPPWRDHPDSKREKSLFYYCLTFTTTFFARFRFESSEILLCKYLLKHKIL